jgi:hypothetical protein
VTIAPIAFGTIIVLAVNSKGKAGMAGIEAMAGVRTAILISVMMIPAVAYASINVPIGGTRTTAGGAIVRTVVLIVSHLITTTIPALSLTKISVPIGVIRITVSGRMDVVGTAAYLIITTLFHFDMSLMIDPRDVGTHWACVREIVIPMRTVQPA